MSGARHAAIAGELEHIEIVSRDRFGNRIGVGGADLSVMLLPMSASAADEPAALAAPPTPGRVIDRGDRTYVGTYSVSCAGQYALSVCSTQGGALCGSPFHLTVAPAAPAAERSSLVPQPFRGAAVTRGYAAGGGAEVQPYTVPTVVAGEELSFGIRLRDMYGNRSELEDDAVEVEVLPAGGAAGGAGSLPGGHPPACAVRAIEHVDLCGVVVITLHQAGEHDVSVRLGAVLVGAAPARVRVRPALACATHCYLAHSVGSMTIPATTKATLTLLTADAWGNPLVRGGAAVSAEVVSPGASATTIEDLHDGAYAISWTTPVTGRCRVSVLVGCAHVQGFPFSFRVTAAPGELGLGLGLG